ncbi:unnamed protein product [Closterium sp. Naga37s-1]|nr:unnamed protein product [Closterium sp. Naga37s-1]
MERQRYTKTRSSGLQPRRRGARREGAVEDEKTYGENAREGLAKGLGASGSAAVGGWEGLWRRSVGGDARSSAGWRAALQGRALLCRVACAALQGRALLCRGARCSAGARADLQGGALLCRGARAAGALRARRTSDGQIAS